MRILVLSNLYPPYYLGGYELACAEVVEALRQRGHEITVLTSWHGLKFPRAKSHILRLLRCVWLDGRSLDDGWRNPLVEVGWSLWNRSVLSLLIRNVRPAVLHVFNPGGLGGLFLDLVHSQSVPVVHDVFDPWLPVAYTWDPWFRFCRTGSTSVLKNALGSVAVTLASPFLRTVPTPVDLTRSYFRSEYLRQYIGGAGLNIGNAPVIYHGLRLTDLQASDDANRTGDIAFAGRLRPEKGVHVLLQALLLLKRSRSTERLKVTIMGSVADLDYWHQLQELAIQLLPQVCVDFTGQLARSDMNRLLRKHSVFAFPVVWDEPFGIVLLEALAAGAAVVTTATGGAAEILTDRENCLVVPREDPVALAGALDCVLCDVGLRRRLSARGLESVKRYNFDQSIDLIEGHLHSVASRS